MKFPRNFLEFKGYGKDSKGIPIIAQYEVKILGGINEMDITRNYHKGNPESVNAYKKKIRHSKSKVGELILGYLKKSDGLTCEELEDLTAMKHQTVSARLTELKKSGRVIVIGKRKTRSNCLAAVYVAKTEKPYQIGLFG